MTIDIQQDWTSGDILLLNGGFQPVRNSDRVSQKIFIRLNGFIGEWWLDPAFFVPWYEGVLGKGKQRSLVDSTIKNQITTVSGVKSLTEYSFDYEPSTRSVTIGFTVLTEEDEIATGQIQVEI